MAKRILASAVMALAVLASAPRAQAGRVLDSVRAAGVLSCGFIVNLDDYSKDERHGTLSALGIDVCRAVAAAVLGDPGKVKLAGYPDDQHGLGAIKSGLAALVVGATPDVTNGRVYDVGFAPTIFHDGQGFLVPAGSGITKLADLADKEICFIAETDVQTDLIAAMQARGIRYRPFPFEEVGEMAAALVVGHCDAVTADISALATIRADFHARTTKFEILAETITKDPYAPAYSRDDAEWSAIVDATVNALLQAEESGVTHANVHDMAESDDPAVRLMLGLTPGTGRMLGLDNDWAVRAIAAVGNYGEMFDRDLGEGSELRLARGLNKPWTQGGLMMAAPLR